jgi:pimeloyl-ACP methyl ester carboxylesterase
VRRLDKKNLKLKDLTLSFVDEGEGKAIVLLHGFCGSSRYWESIIPQLAERYRVIAPDLPGHGQSGLLPEGATIEGMADTIKELIDELNLGKVTLFGHSLGGYITLAFAEKYTNQLNGFSLVHSTAHPDSDEAKKGRMANVEKVQQQGIQALIDGLVPKLFSPKHLDEGYVKTAKEIGYGTKPEGAIRTLIAMKNRPDRNHVLQETSLHVLLIAGEQDQIIPAEKTFSVTKDNITQAVIKGAGHMSMYERPEGLSDDIKRFLSRVV